MTCLLSAQTLRLPCLLNQVSSRTLVCLAGRNRAFAEWYKHAIHRRSPRRVEALPTSEPFTMLSARCGLMVSLCGHRGNEGRPGAAFTDRPYRALNFCLESSRVRRLPVARSLSGSNHILKGFLTRNTGMKKYIAPVARGSGFHGWFYLMFYLMGFKEIK